MMGKRTFDETETGKPVTGELVDEMVHARWVIPVDEDGALANHTVVVKDGKVLAVLPSAEAKEKYCASKVTELPTSAVLPGFVNAHTHTPMVYLRGVSDDIPLKQWLETCIWPLEGKFCSPEFVQQGTELAVAEMLLGGTTCFNDMYWFPDAVCKAVVDSGIRAAVGIIAIEFPFGTYGTGPDDYLSKGVKVMEDYKGEDRLSFTVSMHAPYTCSDATLEKGRALSEKHNLPYHIHLHETAEEPEASEAGNKASTACHMSDQKITPVANLKRLGCLNDRLVAVHMTALKDEEIQWCADSKATVVHCPASNLKLASGFCRVADLVKAGVNVALGTDGASSNNTLDMMNEMKLGAMLAKGVAKNAEAVPATVALRMATLNGAKALKIDKVCGSLVAGKDADMIAIDFGNTPGLWPEPTSGTTSQGFDPVTHIVYSGTRDQVTNVWVKGRRLVENRRLTTLNLEKIHENAKTWGEKITQAVVEMRK